MGKDGTDIWKIIFSDLWRFVFGKSGNPTISMVVFIAKSWESHGKVMVDFPRTSEKPSVRWWFIKNMECPF
jgi:hypothetical protein